MVFPFANNHCMIIQGQKELLMFEYETIKSMLIYAFDYYG